MSDSSDLGGSRPDQPSFQQSDKQLLSGVHSGDEPAATSLYARYAKRLLGYARRTMGHDLEKRVRREPEFMEIRKAVSILKHD